LIVGEKGKVPLEVGLLKRVCAVPAGPNIIQMSEYILGRRYMFIFMELLESYTSLEDVIYKKTGPLSEEKAKHAFRQIVQAVLHCHSRGVFHNDIKPNNIMYQTTTGQIKLIDFGYGDLLKEKYYPHAPGTPAYWPPEWYLFRKYKAEPVTCKISYTNEISGGFTILQKCLCSHPIDRLTLKDISIHSWLR
uniref:Serine/threonine-protein kinase 1 n=1 Tax=Erpetoichthys calabaricus TaxID=27687 RepID=A0A8C4SCS9_ERPCA